MIKKLTRSSWYKRKMEPKLSQIGWFEYLLLRKKSALHTWGWFRSRRELSSVDAKGNPIPWYTYSFLDAFSDRIPSNIRVFEYGSGNSTNWWADRTKEVTSVEHDPDWFDKVQSMLRSNAKVLYRELEGGKYAQAINELDEKFDLIIIDGRDRVNCAHASQTALSDSGVIIWDNTERDRYQSGIDMLISHGFKQLRFTGFIPIDFMPSETSIFYRDGNCFGL